MNKANKAGFMIAIFVIALNSLLGAVGMKETGINTLAMANLVLLACSSLLVSIE